PAALQQAAPAALATNAAAASAAPTLAPPVGTPDWADALSQKVVFLSNAHQQSAELTLNPPDLGPLQVVLRVADNHAHALFVSQHAQVRDAVEAALPKLREAMEAGGLGLGSASVSDGGFASAQQQQTPQRQSSDGSATRRAFGATTADAALDDVSATTSSGATRRSVGMVDTFA
ncbi:flagellar hook-length control protein FliK, partial [Burkholderia oklahomensis]